MTTDAGVSVSNGQAREADTRLVRVTTPHYVAGFLVDTQNGLVTERAYILRHKVRINSSAALAVRALRRAGAHVELRP